MQPDEEWEPADQGPDSDLTRSEEYKLLLSELYFRLEERDKWANHAIQYLLFGNGGGVALLFAFVGSQRAAIDKTMSLGIALGCFVLGIIVLGGVVGFSGRRARAGRRAVRKLMEGYLTKGWSYKSAFFHLGTLPSKWKIFSRLILLSFALFLAGVGSSAYYLWTSYPPEAHGGTSVTTDSNSS